MRWLPRCSDFPHTVNMLAFQVSKKHLVAGKKKTPGLRKGWALIRVRLAGICNTDLEILRGYHNFTGTPGHEFVGEVVDVAGVSKQIKKRWMDKRVAGEINVACSAYGFSPICEFCRRGLKTHCARRTVLGIVAHDGAFAEYLSLPVENLHAIPTNVSDEKAVFIEPLAAACEILEQRSHLEDCMTGAQWLVLHDVVIAGAEVRPYVFLPVAYQNIDVISRHQFVHVLYDTLQNAAFAERLQHDGSSIRGDGVLPRGEDNRFQLRRGRHEAIVQ